MPGPWWHKNPNAIQAFAAVSRTADPTAVTINNVGNFPIAQILISATAASLTPSVVFNFDVKNVKANKFVEVLESAAVTGISENVYQIGGVGAATANISTVLHPGAAIRIRPVHADTDPITYQVTVQWLRK